MTHRPLVVTLALPLATGALLVAGVRPAAASTGSGSAAAPSAAVSTPTTLPGVATRLVLTTNTSEHSTTGTLTVANTGSAALHVAGVAISGPQASSFTVTSPAGGAADLEPGEHQDVSVRFQPPSGSPIEQYATASVRTDDAAHPTLTVALAGAFAPGVEGPGEPSLAQLFRVLGYTTSPAPEGTSNYVSNNRAPRHDERISPYWVAADPAHAVQLRPIGRYVTHETSCPCGRTRWALHYPDRAKDLVSFPADPASGFGPGNERLFPAYSGTTTFSPDGAFQLFSDAGVSSDDGRNANAVHDWRFYPARDAQGGFVPDTWLAAFDIGTDPSDKNWDYQDAIFLLTNATPWLPTAAVPSSSTLKLDFSATRAGTVADASGQGTGFASVQPNSRWGTAYDPSLVHLDTGSGVLRLTAAPGTFVGPDDDQVDALQLAFDASRYRSRVSTRLLGPLDDLTLGDRAGLFLGPDDSNYVTVEASSQDGGTLRVSTTYEAFSRYPYENNPHGRVTASAVLPVAAADVRTLDLRISADVVSGQLITEWRVNAASDSAPWTSQSTVAPRDVMRWFSTQGHAGIRTTRPSTAPAVTTAFDQVRIDPW